MNYIETTITISNKEVVDKAREILESKSLDLEDCVLAFLEQVVKDGNFPFDLTIESATDPTVQGMVGMVEIARRSKTEVRKSYKEMINDIRKEV